MDYAIGKDATHIWLMKWLFMNKNLKKVEWWKILTVFNVVSLGFPPGGSYRGEFIPVTGSEVAVW